ncbi:MAG: PAS domain-containing protein, partial [Flavobacterium sp.]|nr:PAS domain-containing protein [Flavobacterium sp.]
LWKLVYFKDEREQIKKLAFEALNKQDKNILLQYQYLHKNGKIIWRQDRINIFYNEQGRAIKVVDIVSDITKTKRLENLVRRKNEQLALQIIEKDKVTENFVAFQNNKWQEIAANLHDNISQLLFATNLHLSNFTNEHASYEKAKDILQIALNEIKYITQATKNLVIQDKGLQKALKEFIENNNYLNNIKITKIAHAEFYQHFSSSEQIILFTIIQEIIQNAIKHSQSTDVYLLLSFEDGKYSVKVIDNGVGIPADYTNGMGIYNIEKNVRLLNGSIKMYNDNGLTVEINLN